MSLRLGLRPVDPRSHTPRTRPDTAADRPELPLPEPVPEQVVGPVRNTGVEACLNESPPEPETQAAGKRTVSEPDAGCIDRLSRMHLLETEARMVRGVPEAPVGFTSAALDVLGQPSIRLAKAPGGLRDQRASGSRASVRPARCSLRASSARRSRACCDWANAASLTPASEFLKDLGG